MAFAVALAAQTFDIVLANGRVMDPETNLDAVRNVGIRDGKIAAVSEAALEGRTVIDAKGLVVTAGFIDLHSHGQTPENYGYKARDGVTTALEMEVGVNPVSDVVCGAGRKSACELRRDFRAYSGGHGRAA